VAEAKTIAIRAAGGGRVTKVERETEHGRAVWDVEVYRSGVEHDIDVDRATGEVLRHKTDRDDKSDRDDDKSGSGNSGSGSSGSGKSGSGKGGHGSDDDHDDDHGSGGHGSDD
jgi:hypothetical protein